MVAGDFKRKVWVRFG